MVPEQPVSSSIAATMAVTSHLLPAVSLCEPCISPLDNHTLSTIPSFKYFDKNIDLTGLGTAKSELFVDIYIKLAGKASALPHCDKK